jgi:acyl-CoA thioester hydrolase
VRVYWEDTDAGGVVFYANYLKYLERARTEWLRARGVSQSALQISMGGAFVVADLHMRYLAAARLDDLLNISVRTLEKGRASVTLEQEVWRDDTLLVQAQVRLGFVDLASMRPLRMPSSLLQCLAA